ncbi:MAG TPA: hypothetical protein VM286_09145 [Candidatus Thermoplasmatota archaeon]|nr:hypothetical protein [Candidatus Thermoplasmatota archaeon]
MARPSPERHTWQGRPVLCPHCSSEQSIRSQAWLRTSARAGPLLAPWRSFNRFECARCGHSQIFR